MTSQVRTVQDLLRDAVQLSPKEQFKLANQILFHLFDQQLETPTANTSTELDLNNQEGSIDYLLTHPIPVRNFKPMSRDEIYDRC